MVETVAIERTGAALGSVRTAEDANRAFAQVEAARHALKELGQLQERMAELVEAEARLVQEVARSWAGMAHGRVSARLRRAMAAYMAMDAEERDSTVAYCLGYPCSLIGALVRRERADRKVAEFEQARIIAEQTAAKCFERYEEVGSVSIAEYDRRIAEYLGGAIGHGLRERMRDKLLKAGAVSAGDGMYVNPDVRPEAIIFAVETRIRSVVADLRALRSLYEDSGCRREDFGAEGAYIIDMAEEVSRWA